MIAVWGDLLGCLFVIDLVVVFWFVIALLVGVRVVDLMWVWVGLYVAMQLVYLGVEVVKVELLVCFDVIWVFGLWVDGEFGFDWLGYYN